jgi:hypothetical protein
MGLKGPIGDDEKSFNYTVKRTYLTEQDKQFYMVEWAYPTEQGKLCFMDIYMYAVVFHSHSLFRFVVPCLLYCCR